MTIGAGVTLSCHGTRTTTAGASTPSTGSEARGAWTTADVLPMGRKKGSHQLGLLHQLES